MIAFELLKSDATWHGSGARARQVLFAGGAVVSRKRLIVMLGML